QTCQLRKGIPLYVKSKPPKLYNKKNFIFRSNKDSEKMALQWMILTYVVAAEAAIAILLTLPSPKAIKSRFVSLISLTLQPSLFIIPFAGFQLLDIYWKNEHRLMCTGEICTAAERDRYEKSIYKAQRNAILCVAACLLYWCIYRVCKYYKEIQSVEEVEKRLKDE
uniref:Endoplasmic reticulum transmembrane protein n=3 Tax=Solanum subgen. Lycopersicon TaxID=49274 RepID=A0A3Q7FNM9_SOLLC